MNPNEQIPSPDDILEEIDMDATATVDDFIKELEAKEKDLHITADLTIEIAESDFDTGNIPEFVQQELSPVRETVQVRSQAGDGPGLKTRLFELQNEIETLKTRVSSLRTERNDVQEKSDRRLKDFENYKYRMDRERRGAFIDQISNLASQMLPVLDNLDRALNVTDGKSSAKGDEFQQFYDGIYLVSQQVNEILSGMGVQPIATVGEAFDPNFHEAVAVEEREDIAANTILEEMLRGYRIGNRVIRHSMVKVTTAPPGAKKDIPQVESDVYLDPANAPDSFESLPEIVPPVSEASPSEAE